MFAEQLTANESARNAVRKVIEAGVPTYAECGGLMYLCQQIVDFEARSFPMVAVLPTTAVMGKRLTLGYRQATAVQDGVMLTEGTIAWGHEFHRSHLTQESGTPAFEIRGQGLGKIQHSTFRIFTHPHPHPSSPNHPFPLLPIPTKDGTFLHSTPLTFIFIGSAARHSKALPGMLQ